MTPTLPVHASMDDVIDVAFGFDSHYAPHAACVIASLVGRAPGARFRFLLIHAGVGPEVQSRIQTVAPRAQFLWHEVNDDDLPPFARRNHLTRAVLFRLGLEKMAPKDCQRVIYLDSDLIVLRDLRDLWTVDLGSHPIGAVIDGYVDSSAFARQWGLADQFSYFNSGVLLIDLAKVRDERLFSAAIALVAKHERDLPYGDQDALNLTFWGRWHPLNVMWNVQRHMVPELGYELSAEKQLNGQRPAIVHFMGEHKPWLPENWHPWAGAYWESLARTSFTADVARAYDVSLYRRLRLRLRWLRRRPR
jgi:lipopolysaccharide biosynthesis glycosyltransferase